MNIENTPNDSQFLLWLMCSKEGQSTLQKETGTAWKEKKKKASLPSQHYYPWVSFCVCSPAFYLLNQGQQSRSSIQPPGQCLGKSFFPGLESTWGRCTVQGSASSTVGKEFNNGAVGIQVDVRTAVWPQIWRTSSPRIRRHVNILSWNFVALESTWTLP